jgi:cyclase
MITGSAVAGYQPEAAFVRALADGVYAYIQPDGSWNVSNAGIVTAPDTTIVIDTLASEPRNRLLLDQIKAVQHGPVQILVNTHAHPDHVNGNGLLNPPTILGRSGGRKTLLNPAPRPTEPLIRFEPFGHTDPRPPNITIEDPATIWAGDRKLRLIPMPAAHTAADLVVWLPDERILFAGDLVMYGWSTPFAAGEGSVQGSLDALEKLRDLDPLVVVPGHGDVGDVGLIDGAIRYFEFVLDAARAGHAAGKSPLAAARELDLGEFSQLGESERIVGNLMTAYADLGEPRATFWDAVRAMVEFVGHPLGHDRPKPTSD